MLDKFRRGRTIKEWIEVDVKRQLKEYIEGPEVKKSVEDGLVLRASIVVIIGSRHILLWNMIKGDLAAKPVLLGDKLVKETTSVGLPQKALEKPVLPGDRLVKKIASVSIEPVPKKASEKPQFKAPSPLPSFQTPNNNPVPTTAGDDDEFAAFASAVPPSSDLPPLQDNERRILSSALQIVLEFERRSPMLPDGPISLRAKFSSGTSENIKDITFQLAVPMVSRSVYFSDT